MSLSNKKYFTLIEIVFALGVIVVALAAILPLITVGMRTSKDSISDNYVADTAEQFLHYMAVKCKNDWATELGKLSTEKPEKDLQDEGQILPMNKISKTNLYTMTSYDDIYAIQQGTTTITDFSGIIRVWKSPVISQTYSGNGWDDRTDSSYTYSAGLNIEISWPAEMPYDQRDKKYFYLEIFKPN